METSTFPLTETEFATREEALAEWARMLEEEEELALAEEAEQARLEAEWEMSVDPHVLYGVSRDMF